MEKTAFTTLLGLCEFVTMLLGLHGAAVTFQCIINQVLHGREDFTALVVP